MSATTRNDGRSAPEPLPELARFAFLIGTWDCTSVIRHPEDGERTCRARWTGRLILDGHVIADEFRQWGPDGELMQLGQNYRSFDARRRVWVMRWHDALASTWLDLSPDELGGVRLEDDVIRFVHRVPPAFVGTLFPEHALFRITFSDVSADGFLWRAELSVDHGASWTEAQRIEARRAEG